VLDDGLILAYSFEENFGFVYGEVIKKFPCDIHQSVVALASFKGERRFFACTGFFIEWKGCTIILTSASLVAESGDRNKIDENLRIEVLLPNEQRRQGTLQHYSLHYNVALVSVNDMDFHARPANMKLDNECPPQVAALGRCFESGKIMAVCGDLVDWTGTLDCNFLIRSSCKTTKAGIGGPLIGLDGKVIGMNFYDKKIGTPYMPWDVILKILACFENERYLRISSLFWLFKCLPSDVFMLFFFLKKDLAVRFAKYNSMVCLAVVLLKLAMVVIHLMRLAGKSLEMAVSS
jgi:hypothetical protein